MKLAMTLTIISTSLALVACGGGWTVTHMTPGSLKVLEDPKLPQGAEAEGDTGSEVGVDQSAINEETRTMTAEIAAELINEVRETVLQNKEIKDISTAKVTVGDVEEIRELGKVGVVLLKTKGSLEGGLNLNIDDEGDKVSCENTDKGIKITASSKNFEGSQFSVRITHGQEIPSKIVLNQNTDVDMSLVISPETGLFVPDLSEGKCVIALARTPKSDILNAKINCPMDEVQLDGSAKIQLTAVVQCNLTGSQEMKEPALSQ